MKTPYVPHLFGEDALAKSAERIGWLTAGVASSIAWPQDDVWVEYHGNEYLLHGARKEGGHCIAPCISTPAHREQLDEAFTNLYRFTSVLGFYKYGYVDITGHVWGSRVIRYSSGNSHHTLLQGGTRTFDCNHMPIIEDEQVRKALAFLREGRRLKNVHEPYSFLSFFKVIESQFQANARKEWVELNLDRITEVRAVARIKELRDQGINVNSHLYESGRCAVAHASVGGNIVDPDIPSDRKRIAADLYIIEELASRYVKFDAGVPDEGAVFDSRDRLAPWHTLMPAETLISLKAGGSLEYADDLGELNGAAVSLRLWPDFPAQQFRSMRLIPIESGDGILKFILLNARSTVVLTFAMDTVNGRLHTLLDESGMRAGTEITEQDIEDFTRYFHSVIGNRKVELTIEGAEPVDCEVVIPINIIPQAPEEAVAVALEQFRLSKR